MADITMCTNTLCPNAGHCHRVKATPSNWQSYSQFEYGLSPDGVKCDNYWPVYEVTAGNSTRLKEQQ